MMWLTLAAFAQEAIDDEAPTESGVPAEGAFPPEAPRPSEEAALGLLSRGDPVPAVRSERHRSTGLVVAGAVSAVLGAVALGVAADARAEYTALPRGTAELYRTNQRFGYAGLALVGVGGGLTVGAVRLWEW